MNKKISNLVSNVKVITALLAAVNAVAYHQVPDYISIMQEWNLLVYMLFGLGFMYFSNRIHKIEQTQIRQEIYTMYQNYKTKRSITQEELLYLTYLEQRRKELGINSAHEQMMAIIINKFFTNPKESL